MFSPFLQLVLWPLDSSVIILMTILISFLRVGLASEQDHSLGCSPPVCSAFEDKLNCPSLPRLLSETATPATSKPLLGLFLPSPPDGSQQHCASNHANSKMVASPTLLLPWQGVTHAASGFLTDSCDLRNKGSHGIPLLFSSPLLSCE